MATELVPPTQGGERFNCPRCGAFAHQHWSGLMVPATVMSGSTATRTTVNFDDDRGVYRFTGASLRSSANPYKMWTMSFCTSCSQCSVWRGSSLVYPAVSAAPEPHANMPTAALSLYEEASAVLPVSRRAAAALARAALEAALREILHEPKKRLDDLIGDLAGKVSGPLWELLTGLRYLGNVSLHGEGDESELVALYLEGDAASVVEPFFGAINSVIEELVAVPARSRALYNMIPGGVREAAERKAGGAQK